MPKTFPKYKERGAYHYDWYKDNTFNYRDCVDKCVEFCKGPTLDIGAGEGLIVEKLLARGISAVGYDNDLDAVALSDSKVAKVDITRPFSGKWEYMVCLNVIEHLEDQDIIKKIFNKHIIKAAIIITDLPGQNLGKFHTKELSPYELSQLFYTRKVKRFNIGYSFHGIEVYK